MNNILMGLFISRLDMAEKSSELEGRYYRSFEN